MKMETYLATDCVFQDVKGGRLLHELICCSGPFWGVPCVCIPS